LVQKVGVSIQKKSEIRLGSKARGEENGKEVFCYSPDPGVWDSVVSSASGVRGGVPYENGFTVI